MILIVFFPILYHFLMIKCIYLQWWREANSFHVCLTSYKLLMKDQCHFMRKRWRHLVLDEVQLIKNMTQKHWETIFALQRSELGKHHYSSVVVHRQRRKLISLKKKKKLNLFHYCALKPFLSLFWVKCLLFSEQRILLISSPLQNTLKELWTMIHFLLPGITKPYSDFPVKAGTDQNQDYCHKLVIRLHRVRTESAHFLPLTPAVPE